MSQNTNILLPPVEYTRTDYTALRAYCMRLPLERIESLYYSEDSPQLEKGLERYLLDMRDKLIERATENNPLLAHSLTHSRKTGNVPPAVLSILVEAADKPTALPSPVDPISQWFRPRTTQALKTENLQTLSDLVRFINRRGSGWWRSIPRIGEKRARATLTWLQRHSNQLGDVAPAPSPALTSGRAELLDPSQGIRFLPLDRFYLPEPLSGATGANRSPLFCFLSSARDDLSAVQCYLRRFDDQPHTQRAYRKELERFVLWSVHVTKKPLCSLLVDECEAYKRFLVCPTPDFRGPSAPKSSGRWRPFADKAMEPSSQAFAIKILRAAFDWLVKVRYLAGNPWAAVDDPKVVQEVDAIQVRRALSFEAWTTVVEVLQRRGQVQEYHQDRVALAAMLLMGDSGLRRFELVGAQRRAALRSKYANGLLLLTVLGKRNKKRVVPVSSRTVAALQAHWADRGEDFADVSVDRPLIAPIVVPQTPAALKRHGADGEHRQGYSPNAIYALVASALERIRKDLQSVDEDGQLSTLSVEDIEKLGETSPHALRHTFGSLAAEKDMPLDWIQEVLGHEDSATTKIYVKAHEKRIAEGAARFFDADQDNG